MQILHVDECHYEEMQLGTTKINNNEIIVMMCAVAIVLLENM